jgi:hypothetical protein
MNTNKKKLYIKKILQDTIDIYFKPWVNNSNIIKFRQEIETFYNENKISKYIVKINIENNKIKYFDSDHLVNLRPYATQRAEILRNFITRILNGLKINIKNITFYVTMHDYVVSTKYPIFGYAKEHNKNGILIPDWTFFYPYKSNIKENWNKQKYNIIKKCELTNFNDKKDIIFFQGANTSSNYHDSRKTDIRNNLKIESKNNNKMIILLNSKIQSSPSDWCNYRYLYDLPGARPWSVRLKELFLTKSLIIKVDVKNYWINFYSNIFIPNEDYIQLFFKETTNKSIKKKEASKIYNLTNKIIMYINTKPNMYNIITNRAFEKIKMLDMNMLVFYFETLFIKYLKTFY